MTLTIRKCIKCGHDREFLPSAVLPHICRFNNSEEINPLKAMDNVLSNDDIEILNAKEPPKLTYIQPEIKRRGRPKSKK